MPFSEIGKMDLEVPVPMFILGFTSPFYDYDPDRRTRLEDALVSDVSVLSGDLAIIPDQSLDPDQWVLSNKPFLHVRVGVHVWEDLRGERGPVTNYRLREIFMRGKACPAK